MNDRINVLLRDDSGVPIGTGTVPLELLERGPVHVAVPWWPGSSRAWSVELRLEGEPAQVDGTAAEPAAEPTAPGWDEPLPVPLPETAPEGFSRIAGTDGPVPAVVAFDVDTGHGLIHVRDQATPARTIGIIAAELAQRLGLDQELEGGRRLTAWTLADPKTGTPYDVGRHLTASADGHTFALVPVGVPAQTGR